MPSTTTSTTNNPLPTLFLIEAILKVLGGAAFLFTPTSILSNVQHPPHSRTSIALIRNLGTQTIAFSVPLFLAARSDATSVKSRRIVYWALLGREGFFALGLVGQIIWSHVGGRREGADEERERLLEEGRSGDRKGEEEDRVGEMSMFRRGLWIWVAELVPFVVGRVWVLGWRRKWFV